MLDGTAEPHTVIVDDDTAEQKGTRMIDQPDGPAIPHSRGVPAPPELRTVFGMETDGRDSLDDGDESQRRSTGLEHERIGHRDPIGDPTDDAAASDDLDDLDGLADLADLADLTGRPGTGTEMGYERNHHTDHDIGEHPGSLYDAMGQLYGSAAALVRGDRPGAELLIADLCRSIPSLEELLVTVAVATLERLEDAFRHVSIGDPRRPIAQQLMTRAASYRIARAATIHAAAWRLDPVRRGDRSVAADNVVSSRRVGNDGELVCGAVALFAAALELGATARGIDAESTARRLCYAVILERQ